MQNLGLDHPENTADIAAPAFGVVMKNTPRRRPRLWVLLRRIGPKVTRMEDLPDHLRCDLGLPLNRRTRLIAPLTLHYF